ncbi:MAG TPA: hypothetical protein VGH19_06765 [Verrucomicrobiae bacterium]
MLGQTKPLEVVPCRFSNAKGDLKDVDHVGDIRRMAGASAVSFKANIRG